MCMTTPGRRSDTCRCALEFLHFSPFSKGIEALRKLRRVFCGRGSSLGCTTPPVVPLAKGGQNAAAGRVGQPERLTLAQRHLSLRDAVAARPPSLGRRPLWLRGNCYPA